MIESMVMHPRPDNERKKFVKTICDQKNPEQAVGNSIVAEALDWKVKGHGYETALVLKLWLQTTKRMSKVVALIFDSRCPRSQGK